MAQSHLPISYQNSFYKRGRLGERGQEVYTFIGFKKKEKKVKANSETYLVKSNDVSEDKDILSLKSNDSV